LFHFYFVRIEFEKGRNVDLPSAEFAKDPMEAGDSFSTALPIMFSIDRPGS